MISEADSEKSDLLEEVRRLRMQNDVLLRQADSQNSLIRRMERRMVQIVSDIESVSLPL